MHPSQFQLVAQVGYCLAISLIKISILFFYLRFILYKPFRWFIYFIMFVVSGYGIGSVGVNAFACSPVRKVWDPAITYGRCIDRTSFYVANGSINIATDFVMLCIPITIVSKLKMPLRQKILIALVFSIASL